jgi:acetoin utilization protein AcuB
MDKGVLKGIITLTDLNQASPSPATSLSVHELNYILAKTKIKDLIPKNQRLITIKPDEYIETTAKIMRQNTISGLPVVDDDGKLVGIITETDIFDALVEILGVKKAHSRIDIYAEERIGSLAEITGLIAAKNMNILNAVAYFCEAKNKYKVILRLEELDCAEVVNELKEHGYEIESVLVWEKPDK